MTDLGEVICEEQGVRFETGLPLTFRFVRNTEASPYFGSKYQQDIEPAGRYLIHNESPGELARGWESGEVTFERPLVIAFNRDPDYPDDDERGSASSGVLYDETSWKKRLSDAYKGAAGVRLSKLLLKDGWDGVVAVNQWVGSGGEFHAETREIVDLRPARTWRPRRRNSDEERRQLERAAATGDRVAARRLAAELERMGDPMPMAEILLDEAIRSGDQAAIANARIRVHELRLERARQSADHMATVEELLVIAAIRADQAGRDPDLTVRPPRGRRWPEGARGLWLRETGRQMTPAHVIQSLETIVERVRSRLPEIAPGAAGRAAERARLEAAREVELARQAAAETEAFEAQVGRTLRASSWEDVIEVRDRIEGRSKQRCVPGSVVREVVEEARAEGRSHWAADTDVPKTYKYPVTYTQVTARRSRTGDVLVTFTRDQTWGRSNSRSESIVVPAGMGVAVRNPIHNPDALTRELERRAMSGDVTAQDRLLVERERLGETGLGDLVARIRSANASCPRGQMTEDCLRDVLGLLGRRNAKIAWTSRQIDLRPARPHVIDATPPISIPVWRSSGRLSPRQKVVVVLGVRDVTRRGEDIVLLGVGVVNDVRSRLGVVDPAAVWPELAPVAGALESHAHVDDEDSNIGGFRRPCRAAFVLGPSAGLARDPLQREPYFEMRARFLALARGEFAHGTPESAGFVVIREIHVDDGGAGPHGAVIEGLP